MSETLSYTCPCCGGSLKFDSSLQKVKCQYCDTEFEIEDLKNYDESLKAETVENTEWKENTADDDGIEMPLYTCTTCGGEIICDENTASTLCPYCGNPVSFTKRLSGILKPKYIIPFKLEKEDAQANLNKYFKGKILLPSSFIKENVVKDITSLYVPYWIFDADVYGYTTFKATITRYYSDSKYDYVEKRFYRIIRNGNIGFEHIPVDASRKMDDQLMESIEPFDFNEAKDFSQAYLVGYPADKYDVDKEECFKRANQRIKEGTVDAFRSTIHGYDSVINETASINYLSNQASYVFYPVWTLNSLYREKNFQFAMNAQSGKIVGNLPISKLKFTIWMFASFILFGFLAGLIGYFADEESAQTGVIVGIVVGIIITALIMALLVKQVKPVRFNHGAANYQIPNSLNIEVAKDIYLYKTVSKTRRPEQSK